MRHPVETHEDMDTKRLKRLQLLADQRKVKRQADGQALRNVEARRGLTRRRPLSASLAIDCNGTDSENQGALPTELHWFACKTVLKGIA